jgi:hypothetical protein
VPDFHLACDRVERAAFAELHQDMNLGRHPSSAFFRGGRSDVCTIADDQVGVHEFGELEFA